MISELLLVIFVLVITWMYLKRDNNFPPGPIRLPILGHLHLLGPAPHKTFVRWKDTYGSLVGVWFGNYRAVVINDVRLITKALNLSAFSGRPDLNVFKKRREDEITRGLTFTSGSHWAEQRRFAIKTLHKFGFGTNKMETQIQESIKSFCQKLKNHVDEPIEGTNLFTIPVLNSFWSILFSDELSESNPDVIESIRGITSFVSDIKLALPIFLPWLAKLAPNISGFQKTVNDFPMVYKFLDEQVKCHKISYAENQPRDFVDTYLDQVRNTTNRKSSFHISNDGMLDTLFDLCLGGAETTSTSLSWLCAYLINNPQVQAKLQEEIDRVVGRSRPPALADRLSMNYAEAVVQEVMRFSSLAPLAFFHSSTQDVQFEGYLIPKDTMIIPNMYAIHFDETIWGDPHTFRPERFIDSDGKFTKNKNLLAFSTGKRICIGETFARDQLFLFVLNIFQTFSLSAAESLPNLEPNVGFTLSPKPFKMIVTLRE